MKMPSDAEHLATLRWMADYLGGYIPGPPDDAVAAKATRWAIGEIERLRALCGRLHDEAEKAERAGR